METTMWPPVTLIGLGRVGTTLALRIHESGGIIRTVISQNIEQKQWLSHRIGQLFLPEIPAEDSGGIVLLTVPDDAIQLVCSALVATRADWHGWIFAHTSGLHTTHVLAEAAERGAETLSWHPLQTFPDLHRPATLSGVWFATEGTSEGCRIGFLMAEKLGGKAWKLAASQKALYHAAASVGSNFVVALAHVAQSMLAELGIKPDAAREILTPLLTATCQNLRDFPPKKVLTGPIVRGDAGTIRQHLDALSGFPEWATLYRTLAETTTQLAEYSGRLPQTSAHVLYKMVQPVDKTP